MNAVGKLIGRLVIGCALACCLPLLNQQSFAIEELQISVACSNVVLSWPSLEGETYIIQYRQTLTDTNGWQTLTSALPAESGANFTYFIHSNIVQNPSCGSSLAAHVSGLNQLGLAVAATETLPPVPMAIPVDGSGGAVPLMLYPPGINLSGFLIFDPTTGESVSGAGYTVQPSSSIGAQSLANESGGGPAPIPMGGSSGDSGSALTAPETGFYQVARLGVHVIGLEEIANQIVSDSIAIPFEAANEVGSLHNVIVQVDGTHYRGATPLVAPGVHGMINLDTSFLENGDHSIQIIASWLNPDEADPNNHSFSRASDSFTLSVSNTIYFPDWDDEIGELGFAYYSFKTTLTNADWQIAIYDATNILVQVLSGQTSDGIIETNWNLVDLNGTTRATDDNDDLFDAIITVTEPDSSSTIIKTKTPTPTKTKKPPTKRKPFSYPNQGRWAIAYQDMFGNMVNSNKEFLNDNYFGSLGAANGGAVTVFPTPGHPEYGQTFPMRFGYLNMATPPPGSQTIADEKALVRLLTNNINRNFYYQGHTDPTSIATVEGQEIDIEVGKKHYYRFVFLNGCSSAVGTLPAAFGIDFNIPLNLDYFQKHGMRPRTFIGYNKNVNFADRGEFYDPATGGTLTAKIPDCVCYFLSNLEFYLYFGYDISTSIYNAQNDLPELRYGWADGPDLNLYGYQWMHINEFNYKSDWSN